MTEGPADKLQIAGQEEKDPIFTTGEPMSFDQAWEVAKASGPYLNRIDSGEHHIHPEGYQDFRAKIYNPRERMYAGNYPDKSGWYPTKRVSKKPDGGLVITQHPAGSNINLTSPRLIIYPDDWTDRDGKGGILSPETEEQVISEIASTGRHEAVHQAVHDLLMEEGYKSPFMSHGDEEEAYHHATEWAANLLQHDDPFKAWNALRSHSQFEDNDVVQDIADRRMYGDGL